MLLATEYPAEVMQELQTINPRIGTANINLYAAGSIMREVRGKHLIADFNRVSELFPNEIGRPKAIGPVTVSGNLGQNILDAMATWLADEEMVALRASVLKDGNFEAEDLITDEVFGRVLLDHHEVMQLLFEIPDAYDHGAFCDLGSFLLQYTTTANCFFVYVLGDAERLLKLIAPLALRGVAVLSD